MNEFVLGDAVMIGLLVLAFLVLILLAKGFINMARPKTLDDSTSHYDDNNLGSR